MHSNLIQERHEAHLLIDTLPKEKLDVVRGLLDTLVSPLSKSLATAPVDDEPLNDETIASIEEGRRQIARGEYTTHEDMLREFGG
jgi:hypothetical protein